MKSLILKTACFLFAGTFVMACDQRRHSDQPVSGDGGKHDGVNAYGTIDGAGGVGINGKPIESYRIDPADLPEFKSQIQPVFDSIANLRQGQNIVLNVLRYVTKTRSWYQLTDVDLDKIAPEKMGLPFTNDQWAVQSTSAVFLGEKYKGTEEAKGVMLMHEILMSLKVLRHRSDFEQCVASYAHPELCERLNREGMYDVPKVRAEDYEQVRTLSVWLLKNHKTMTHRQLVDALFDGKFFGSSTDFYLDLSSDDQVARNKRKESDRAETILRAAKSYKFYADFDEITHVAKSTCDVKVQISTDRKSLTFALKVTDRATGAVKNQSQVRVPNAPAWSDRGFFPIDVFQTERASLDNKKPPYSVGQTYEDVSLTFGYGELRRIQTGLMTVTEVQTMADGSVAPSHMEGRRGESLNCSDSEVLLPIEYGNWRALPTQDREMLERKYVGDTFENVYRSRKYDIKLP